jgi:iron complex outermembrane recepter protein
MKYSFKLAALLVTALTPVAAFAQDGAAGDDGPLPEIIVTARKNAETLSDAPVSVSVVGAQQIEELGLNSIDDFAKTATGISFSQAFGRSTDRPVIRGQSNVLAGVQAGVETGAAYFVDGVYYQGDIQGFDPSAIERVEIIKGPQSALYGRNTYAGAINYITKDPTDTFNVSGRLRAAEYREYEAAASVSGPIIADVLGFRAGARHYEYGGQYRNQLTGKRVGQEKSQSAYLTLQLEPSEDIKLRTRLSWQKDDDGPLAIFLQGSAANNCLPGFRSNFFRTANTAFVPGNSDNRNQYYCGVIRAQPNNVQLNTDPLLVSPALGVRDGTAFDGVENEQILATGIFDWDIGGSGWEFHASAGLRDNENYFGTDSDHSNAFIYFGPPPAASAGVEPAFANTNRDDQRDTSFEARISSPRDRPIRAMAGVYFFKQKFQTVDITFASGQAGQLLGTNTSQFSTIKDKAIFGMVEWDITEQLNITAEIRHANEKKTIIDRASATAAGIFCRGEQARVDLFDDGLPAGQTVTCGAPGSFTGTDPRITVNYTTDGGMLIYGVFATGRKPGGFNGTAGVTASLQTGQDFINYLPEKSKGGELGVKFDAFDRRLRVAVAGFYNELSNVQLTSAIPNPAGTGALTSVVTTTGDAETKGFEIDLNAAPVDGFLVNLGISYVDARFTRGCDSDEFIFNSGGLRPNFDTRNPNAAALALCNISGRRLPLGSPWIVNGGFSYEADVGSGGLAAFFNSNFSYEASKYVQVHNQAQTGDTFLLNARMGIRHENWTLALFGRNLTNEDSIPLATRWFDLRYAGTRNGLPTAGTFDGRPAIVESGNPRGFFGTLRKGRTFGVEASFNF